MHYAAGSDVLSPEHGLDWRAQRRPTSAVVGAIIIVTGWTRDAMVQLPMDVAMNRDNSARQVE